MSNPCGGETRAAAGRVDERGNATGLVAAIMLVVAVLVGVVLAAGAYRAGAHRVQGAADLAALAGGEAASAGRDACAAVRRAARVNDVRVASCALTGDEIDFVVSVEVTGESPWRPLGSPLRFEARANAGVIEDGP